MSRLSTIWHLLDREEQNNCLHMSLYTETMALEFAVITTVCARGFVRIPEGRELTAGGGLALSLGAQEPLTLEHVPDGGERRGGAEFRVTQVVDFGRWCHVPAVRWTPVGL